MKYFTEKEMCKEIIDVLQYYDGYYCNLHNEVFNIYRYIDDESEAQKALTEYGLEVAIDDITIYEITEFGEVYTKENNPIEMATALHHILGERFLYEDNIRVRRFLQKHWFDKANYDLNNELIYLLLSRGGTLC